MPTPSAAEKAESLRREIEVWRREAAEAGDGVRRERSAGDSIYSAAFDLNKKNPHTVEDDHGDPETLLADLTTAEAETAKLREELKMILVGGTCGMNAERLLAHYDCISDTPDAIPKLRRFILDLAVRGKLVPQDPTDEPEPELLMRTAKEKRSQAGLPKSWVRTSIGTLLDFRYGKALNASCRGNEGPIPVYGSNGVIGFTQEPLTTCPAIIIGRKGSAGALNLCDGPSWTTDVAYFVEAPTVFDLRFLLNALAALDLDKLGKGVKPGLSRSDAYEQVMCVPPLAEQFRIVAKFDELMALCDRLEVARTKREATRNRLTAASLARLNSPDTFGEDTCFVLDAFAALTTRPDQIKQLRQTILNLAARGKLVPQDANDEPASELLKRIAEEKARLMKAGAIARQKKSTRDPARQFEGLPGTWQIIALGEICTIVTSGSRGWAEFYADTGPGFIRAQNIRFGKLKLDDLASVNPPLNSEGSRTQVAKGDLLIVITGAGVTNPALLDRDLGEAYVSQHVGLVRLADKQLSEWSLLCLMAPVGGRSELVDRAYGAGRPGLNLDNIRSITIPIPPLAEQHRIVAKVKELMALCDRLEKSLTTGKDIRRRLLDALLAEALEPVVEPVEGDLEQAA
jgi:type I restriction enzyme S subunit